jgi:hypothetical protein
VNNTGLCWEIVLEIAKYLPLNDLVTAFTFHVLPLLRMKLSIAEPSDEFMRTMIQKISCERISSLRLKADNLDSTMAFPFARILGNIKFLVLDNPQYMNQVNEAKRYFSSLTCLSLRFDNEVDFHSLDRIFNQIPISIKRFEIHGASVVCSHHHTELLYGRNINSMIESFVLSVVHTPTLLINNCVQGHNKCVLRSIIDFIKMIPNIRYVRVIINQGHIETLLDGNEWMSLVEKCKQLDKITLKVLRNMSQNVQLEQKIQDIKNSLHNTRQSIKFEIKTK